MDANNVRDFIRGLNQDAVRRPRVFPGDDVLLTAALTDLRAKLFILFLFFGRISTTNCATVFYRLGGAAHSASLLPVEEDKHSPYSRGADNSPSLRAGLPSTTLPRSRPLRTCHRAQRRIGSECARVATPWITVASQFPKEFRKAVRVAASGTAP